MENTAPLLIFTVYGIKPYDLITTTISFENEAISRNRVPSNWICTEVVHGGCTPRLFIFMKAGSGEKFRNIRRRAGLHGGMEQ